MLNKCIQSYNKLNLHSESSPPVLWTDMNATNVQPSSH